MITQKINTFTNFILAVFRSKKFFVGIVLLFILQATWIAFSFAYPMVYDEKFHFDIISIYANQFSPIITNQPTAYDYLRDLTHESSHFYHYLMSFPLRFIEVFTDSLTVKVVLLRLMNIGFVAAGLVMFSKLFQKAKIGQIYINLGLLFFILLPIVPFVAATINYDNLLFLLTATYLYICTLIIKSKRLELNLLLWFIFIASFASLVKYTFLPILAVSGIFMVVVIWKKHGRDFLNQLGKSYKKSNKLKTGVLLAVTTVFVGMCIQLYGYNILKFGSPQPKCQVSLGVERCMASEVIQRNLNARATKDERKALLLPDYTLSWVKTMTFTTVNTSANTPQTGGPVASIASVVIYVVVFFGMAGSAILLAVTWKQQRKDTTWYLLALVSVTLIAILYAKNVSGYYALHAAFANQPRYLLSVMPIVLVFTAVAAGLVIKNHRPIKVLFVLALLALFTQGGGVTTHIIGSEDGWYWQNEQVIEVNNSAKNVLEPLIYERR